MALSLGFACRTRHRRARQKHSPYMTIARPSTAAQERLAPLPRALLDALAATGVDAQALATSLGLAPEALASGIRYEDADRFLCAAWDAVADPAIGLKAGGMLRPERFGIVGMAAMTSASFGAAMERKARYWRLIWADAYEVRLTAGEAAAVLMPSGPPRPYTQGKIDMELSSLVTFARLFTGQHVVPLRLSLCQPAPAWHAQYQEVFGCPVQFGAAENALVFSRADYALPLVSHNPEVQALVVGGADAALARMAASPLRQQIEQALDQLLPDGEPTLLSVANRLHRSARTLQRQLAQEALRFTDVLDARRRSAAERHLANGTATAEEVSFLLGFATPSSFFRAFKRWTGSTPEVWRRGLATNVTS